MATNYREMNFEEHIESHLLNSGYRKRAPEEYDKALCLIPDEVLQFIQATQPKEFEKLEEKFTLSFVVVALIRISLIL